MIPKIIHYCWFGGNPEPEDVKKCINSWIKYMPEYKIIRWDENNYDIHKCQYMSDAYNEKKWAFVSDFCRLDVIYTHGGIYLDTDVEVLKSFNPLLQEKMFCGFESRDPIMFKKNKRIEESVAFGLGFGAEAGHPILAEMIQLYKTLNFYNTDGSLNLIACPHYQTQILKKYNLIDNGKTQRFDGGIAYSAEYFCPQSNVTNKMLYSLVNSYSIHHFTVSWASSKDKKALVWKNRLHRFLPYWLASKIISAIFKMI